MSAATECAASKSQAGTASPASGPTRIPALGVFSLYAALALAAGFTVIHHRDS
ncbi:hypothetical protein ACFY2M_35330 [Streptomyces sp. NPDC001276]|uniref:hypothetical protein n=1 Tax=Streptomyces sp. NPDC001276 TaxID=3364555 RepID=UPI00367A7B51